MSAYGIEKECFVVMERKTERELLIIARNLLETNAKSLEPSSITEHLPSNNFTPDSPTITGAPFVKAEFGPNASDVPMETPKPAPVIKVISANDVDIAAEELTSTATTAQAVAVIQCNSMHMTALQPLSSNKSSLVDLIELEPATIVQHFPANTTETTRTVLAESRPLIYEREIPYEYEVEIESEP